MPNRSRGTRGSKRRSPHKSNVIVVDTRDLTVRLQNVRTHSKRLSNMAIPHSIASNTITFLSFNDMSAFLRRLHIHVDRPAAHVVEKSRPTTQCDNMSFWKGVTMANSIRGTALPTLPTVPSPTIARPVMANHELLQKIAGATQRIERIRQSIS